MQNRFVGSQHRVAGRVKLLPVCSPRRGHSRCPQAHDHPSVCRIQYSQFHSVLDYGFDVLFLEPLNEAVSDPCL